MKRITVDVSNETHTYLAAQKELRGSSVSFEANALIELAINERTRKRKTNEKSDGRTDTGSLRPAE